MDFRPCIVIPIYNHKESIGATVRKLAPFNLHCFIVDDGSDEETREVLKSIAAGNSHITLQRLPSNQGKGGAVMAGLETAYRESYTHALQIDADGQHDIADIPRFIATAGENPEALIAGQPVYDESAPKGRLLARNITHFWVAVEILSTDVPDTMCGFRIYPLQATQHLISMHRPGRRMDFDIEIMVRSIWAGITVVRIPTRVIYPPDGKSNFNYFSDNLLITRMHTRLVFGMLRRLPMLLQRKLQRRRTETWHWSQIRESGTVSGIQMLLWAYRILGSRIIFIILFPVVSYFFIINGKSREASRKFLNKAFAAGSRHEHLMKKPSLLSSFRHFLSFAQAAMDKIASWLGDIEHTDIVFEKKQEMINLALAGKGMVIISSHLGNIEVCRALADNICSEKLNALVFTEHAKKYNSVLRKINNRVSERVIHVNRIGPETAIGLKEKINNGEFIIILGDRTAVNSTNRTHYAKFLGEEAPFAQGPFILAALMECPVYLMFCLKHRGQYHVYFEHFSDQIELPRKSRDEQLQKQIQQYANRLEYYCLQEPFQWFNFYDFWRQDQKKLKATSL